MKNFGPIALCIALVSLGCNSKVAPPAEPLNIILVSIDTLRADRLGLQGYERDTSPFLDELATRSMVFTQAVVNTHGTTPSHTSMLSGLYQQTHRVGFDLDKNGLTLPIPLSVPLLPEILKSEGYATLGVSDGGNIGKRFGFARGFDRYDDRGGGLHRVLRRARRYLRALQEMEPLPPFFLMIHSYEAHSPYEPPAANAANFLDPASTSHFDASSENLLRYASSANLLDDADLTRLSNLYDAGIQFVDEQLMAFFEDLDQAGLLDNTLVVVTSDHGEEFGEHGGLLHRGLLYDELLRVPLIIHGPNIDAGSSAAAASTVDIVPTILSRAAIEVPEPVEGINLMAPAAAEQSHSISQYADDRYSVRSSAWKLIVSPKDQEHELYDLVEDPSEQHNIYCSEHPIVRQFRADLRDWLAIERERHTAGARTELSEEDRKKLEGLGYLSN